MAIKTSPISADGTEVPAIAGAYVLAIWIGRPIGIKMRGLIGVSLLPGWYAYAGSARGPGGLAARIRRHLSPDKRPRWHVDQLTLAAIIVEPLAVPGADECDLLARLLRLPGVSVPMPGFGSSDCATCPAHLVALPGRLDLSAGFIRDRQSLE